MRDRRQREGEQKRDREGGRERGAAIQRKREKEIHGRVEAGEEMREGSSKDK